MLTTRDLVFDATVDIAGRAIEAVRLVWFAERLEGAGACPLLLASALGALADEDDVAGAGARAAEAMVDVALDHVSLTFLSVGNSCHADVRRLLETLPAQVAGWARHAPPGAVLERLAVRRALRAREEQDLFQRIWSAWGGSGTGVRCEESAWTQTLAVVGAGPDVVVTSSDVPAVPLPRRSTAPMRAGRTWPEWSAEVAAALPVSQGVLLGLTQRTVHSPAELLDARAGLLARAGTYRGTWQRLLRHELGASYRIHVKESLRLSPTGDLLWSGLQAATLAPDDIRRVQEHGGLDGSGVPPHVLEPTESDLDAARALVLTRAAMDRFSAMAEVEALTRDARLIEHRSDPARLLRPSSPPAAHVALIAPPRSTP